MAGGRAAPGVAGAFHFAVGPVRFYQRGRAADRGARLEGRAGRAVAGLAWGRGAADQRGHASWRCAQRRLAGDAGHTGRGIVGAPAGQAQALHAAGTGGGGAGSCCVQ
ncbi:hypothetical protein G6F58_013613 [Rhizopus delemar]|nr:hypothetical protein G6F58_013613 [Rhizopus delemar]